MDNLSKLNNEELLKKGKSLKIITFILVGLLVVSIIASILNYLENGFRISTLMPIILLAIVFPNIATLKSIKKEIEERGLV